VKLRNPDREVELAGGRKIHHVLGELGINPDTVLVIRERELLTREDRVGDADVISAGSVRFNAAGEHATEVRVKLQYDPPAGKLGATVAWLLGEDPQHQIAEDLRKLKELIESGERPPRS